MRTADGASEVEAPRFVTMESTTLKFDFAATTSSLNFSPTFSQGKMISVMLTSRLLCVNKCSPYELSLPTPLMTL